MEDIVEPRYGKLRTKWTAVASKMKGGGSDLLPTYVTLLLNRLQAVLFVFLIEHAEGGLAEQDGVIKVLKVLQGVLAIRISQIRSRLLTSGGG